MFVCANGPSSESDNDHTLCILRLLYVLAIPSRSRRCNDALIPAQELFDVAQCFKVIN